MDINEIFKLRAYLLIKHLKLIDSQPEEIKGRAREVLVQDFLKPFLPNKLGIDGGVIFSSNGAKSGELDIIVYDKQSYNLFKPFSDYMPKKSRPFPSEVVYAIIEVEKHLDKKKLEKIINKVSKVKALPKTAFYENKSVIHNYVNLYGKQWDYFPTVSVLFAFDSIKIEDLYNHFIKLNSKLKIPLEKQIDMIVILKKGMIISYDPNKKELVFPPEKYSIWAKTQKDSEEVLKIFYLGLMRILTQVWIKPIKVFDYFKSK